jgi:hypothetical protein
MFGKYNCKLYFFYLEDVVFIGIEAKSDVQTCIEVVSCKHQTVHGPMASCNCKVGYPTAGGNGREGG